MQDDSYVHKTVLLTPMQIPQVLRKAPGGMGTHKLPTIAQVLRRIFV